MKSVGGNVESVSDAKDIDFSKVSPEMAQFLSSSVESGRIDYITVDELIAVAGTNNEVLGAPADAVIEESAPYEEASQAEDSANTENTEEAAEESENAAAAEDENNDAEKTEEKDSVQKALEQKEETAKKTTYTKSSWSKSVADEAAAIKAAQEATALALLQAQLAQQAAAQQTQTTTTVPVVQESSSSSSSSSSSGSSSSSHTHSYSWYETKAATCDADGTKEERCSCGDVRSQGTVISKLGHDSSQRPTTGECVLTYNCARCNQQITETNSNGTHDRGQTPTGLCKVTYTCLRCNESITETDSNGTHVDGGPAPWVNNTCTSMQKSYTCTNCNQWVTETIPNPNGGQHDYPQPFSEAKYDDHDCKVVGRKLVYYTQFKYCNNGTCRYKFEIFKDPQPTDDSGLVNATKNDATGEWSCPFCHEVFFTETPQ